jgi:hypothetical protein
MRWKISEKGPVLKATKETQTVMSATLKALRIRLNAHAKESLFRRLVGTLWIADGMS